MKLLPTLALTAILGLGTSAVLIAQDAPAAGGDASTTDKKPAKATKGPRLIAPWSKMGSLTPEQKQQISTIHKKSLAEKKKIEDQEETDILALLTPEQKTEVDKIKEDGTAAKKKPAEPATKPADGM